MEWLSKVFVDIMCLQHSFFLDVRHAWHPVILGFFRGRILRFLDRCVWPIRSLKFLLRLYARMGVSLKVSARSLFVWRMCQFLVSMFLMGGCWALKVVVKGVHWELVLGLSTSRDCLLISRIWFFWVVVFMDG